MNNEQQLQWLRLLFLRGRNRELHEIVTTTNQLQVQITTARSPWYGQSCAYSGCSGQIIRAGDRVITCPGHGCRRVFHQDHYHNLLCWSLYYTTNTRCPAPGCNYDFAKQLATENVAATCEVCNGAAVAIIPLASDHRVVYHPLCEKHRDKYLQPSVGRDREAELREAFQRGLFRGMFPGTTTIGGVKLRYYCEVRREQPQAGEMCIYCATKIRPHDRVAVCPQCGAVYHEDLPSELLCWSAHFDRREGEQRNIYCAHPGCYYELHHHC